MATKTKVVIDTGGADDFFGRVRERARKLDAGVAIEPEIRISFDDVADLVRVLSAERIRVLRAVIKKPEPVSALANTLGRPARAVSRDVDLLQSLGLVGTRYESNPGHGRHRIVESKASRYQLVATI